MAVDWSRTREEIDFRPALTRYETYLRKIGLKDNTITLYLRLINNYLKDLNTNLPLPEDAERFYESLHQRKLSRSAINNFAAAIIKYQEMIGKPVEPSEYIQKLIPSEEKESIMKSHLYNGGSADNEIGKDARKA
jgi:hypothetical protein